MRGAGWLVAGGLLSLAASLLHLGCIAFGPDWFRFFGAPETLVQGYENGSSTLIWMTVAIAAVLAVWAAFAFSGAGRIARLPLLRTGLVAISLIYFARGAFLIPALILMPYPRHEFDLWSSAIVLVYGVVYAVGTWLSWSRLSRVRVAAT